MNRKFKLPVGNFVRITSALTIALMVIMPVVLFFVLPNEQDFLVLPVAGLGILILLGSYGFAPLSVSLEPGKLLVHHPMHTRTYLISSAKVEVVDRKSLLPYMRTFGNGGLFAFTGHFRNSKLGKFRYHSRKRSDGTLFSLDNGTKVVIGLPFLGAWQQAVERETKV